MVVFTCNSCGESLQKPKVEKHYQTMCRTTKNLTCVDCLQDFRGEDYVGHIKCITEAERYAAKGSMPNGVVKKGEAKQEGWTAMLHKIIEKENLSGPLKNLMNIISNYVNVPRKRVKFFNFIMNSVGKKNYNPDHLEQIWALIDKHKAIEYERKKAEEAEKKKQEENEKKPQAAENQNSEEQVPADGKQKKEKAENGESNGHESINGDTIKRKLETNGNHDEASTDIPKKKKKSKNSETTETNQENGGTDTNGAETEANEDLFSYENTILDILKERKQIPLKKLEKKVLKAYVKAKGVEAHTDKQVKKFHKKLRKVANLDVKDNIVILT